MKTKIMMSMFVLSVITIIALFNGSLIDARYLTTKVCEETPYSCFKPAVSFASLR
jgi:hypothetical protein